MVSIVVAQGKNGEIGRGNDLPWNLPDDLKNFRKITGGKTVIMGMNTFEHIVARLGKPLPNRTNIVVTHDTSYYPKGVAVTHSFEEALTLAKSDEREVFVIGGGQLYRYALPFTDRIYLTAINHQFDADTYFPVLDKNTWHELSRVHHPKDNKHAFDFDWLVLERK